jgi:hypothetical protein
MREVPSYPGYLVTAYGDIYSVRQGFPLKIATRMHKGYLHANIKIAPGRHNQRKVPVHQMVLLAYRGPRPSSEHVGRHLDGNTRNNHETNLLWGTAAENVADSIRHGTAVCIRIGEAHPRSKLLDSEVFEIRELVRSGVMSGTAAGKIYGVSQEHASAIARGDPRCR